MVGWVWEVLEFLILDKQCFVYSGCMHRECNAPCGWRASADAFSLELINIVYEYEGVHARVYARVVACVAHDETFRMVREFRRAIDQYESSTT